MTELEGLEGELLEIYFILETVIPLPKLGLLMD